MINTYIVALTESLEKKIAVLDEILKKNAEQAELFKEAPFSFEKYDKTVEEKDILIYRLNKLDEGFEAVFAKVREELGKDRAAYASEILRMQQLISEITEKSAGIEAGEARNKASLENLFRSEKSKLKGSRSSIKAVQSYTQAMNFRK